MKYYTPPYILPDHKEVLDSLHGTAAYIEHLKRKKNNTAHAMTSRDSIYIVTFMMAPIKDDTRKQFCFSSLSAIYAHFSRSLIGCSIQNLYNLRVAQGRPYEGRKCRVIRVPISKSRRN